MTNLLKKNIRYFFLISIIAKQIVGMQYEHRTNQASSKTVSLSLHGTLKDLAIDRICERIKLECENATIFGRDLRGALEDIDEINAGINETILKVIKGINATYFEKLPVELIERIKSRFLEKYANKKKMPAKKYPIFNEPILKSQNLLFREKVAELVKKSLDKKLGIYRCDVTGCDKIFKHESGLSSHKRFAHDDEGLKCEICAESFKNMSSLRSHYIRRHKK